MRMLRWARGNAKKGHIKNEELWREESIEPMTTFLRKRRVGYYGHRLMKEGGYHHEYVKHASAGKHKNGEAQGEMDGQHQG